MLLKEAMDNLKKRRYNSSPASVQKSRSALVVYHFIIGASAKSVYEPDVVVTFDFPNTVTVVAPFDSQAPCRTELNERPLD